MRIVIALGGNAMLRRGEPLTAENQRANIKVAAEQIARVVPGNEVVVAHGNGPQVGLLALQAAAYQDVRPYPLDILGAQTEAMIGYVIEQELGNVLPPEQRIATLLTMTRVDADDPAFENPTKPIGPIYLEEEAKQLAAENGWTVRPDGPAFRRVVASPEPREIYEVPSVRTLLDAGTVVICAGGGGIPTVLEPGRTLRGVEAVVDKDLAAALLATELEADLLVIATDVDGVYADWGTPQQRRLERSVPEELRGHGFAAGSMGPKVEAVCRFVDATGHRAAIGSLEEVVDLVAGAAGTQVVPGTAGADGAPGTEDGRVLSDA